MTKPPFMVTLLPSVDVDLGRWLMQLWGVAYTERPHAPVFHILALKSHGVGKDDYPLLIDGDTKTPTIEKLVAAFDDKAPSGNRLVPDPQAEPELHAEVMDLQHRMRYDMGEGTVHWAYFHFLQHKKLVWPSLTTGVPWFETAFMSLGGYSVIKAAMFKGLGLGPEDAEKALTRIQAAWDEIDARLADGRKYLCGDRLTLADLAFATSGAPMIVARGYGGHLPEMAALPPEMRAVMEPLRDRPAGQFIQRIYDEARLA
ncbi:glutathione S-transferase C-terminal domain-containing protein [Fluviibacterium sp. S390]|uniref:glutathione S-transferase C-terminal domain-containing protein n=1 Tax=Fluviibacterium sp. S390 TaxID=3415139 RepID=UPI003C7B4DFA